MRLLSYNLTDRDNSMPEAPSDTASMWSGGALTEGMQPDGTLSIPQLERFVYETRLEPKWRRDADVSSEYYDGNQLRPDILQEMQDRGIPPLIINLTRPIINSVLGIEAKTRSDWEVTGDTDADNDVASVINMRLNEAQRLTYADRAISFAYGQQIKAGVGWVEVGREKDPFGYKYRCVPVHRREIWWDWRDQSPGLERARYLIRRRWFDEDILTLMFPNYKDLISHAVRGWNGFLDSAFLNTQSLELGRAFDAERATTLDSTEWRDTFRRRAQVFEVWYRVWKTGCIFRLPNGKAIEVDQENQAHCEAIVSGALPIERAMYPRMRRSIWIGPHRILDTPTPLPHQDFPYVPFWGYREDLTGAPHGLIRDMMSSQDEINARRSKLMSLLNARRAVVDDDALNTTFNSHQDVADELGRSDAYIVLNKERKNGQYGFTVETNGDLAQGQFETLKDSKDEMHEASGIFPSMLGDAKQQMSGVAVASLVDQSTMTLAMMNDHYRYARRKVGDLMVAHIRHDMQHEEAVQLGQGRNVRTVVVNRKAPHPTMPNQQIIENSVPAANVKTTLQDVPSTSSYRQQQFAALAEVTKALPPQVQALVIDFVVAASDLKDRAKIVERLRTALNLPDPDNPDAPNPQAAEANAKMQELMQQLQEVTLQMNQWKAKAESRVEASQIAANASMQNKAADTIVALDKNDIQREANVALAAKAGMSPEELLAGTLEQIRPMFGELAKEMQAMRAMISQAGQSSPAASSSS